MTRVRPAAVVVVVAVTIATGAVAPAVADPKPPAAYYGSVTVDGDPAPAGTTVQAVVDGDVVGELTTEQEGEYGGSGTFAEKLEAECACTSGEDTVTFRLADSGTVANETVTWESGDVQRVDLTFPAPEEEPTATPTPTETEQPTDTATAQPTETTQQPTDTQEPTATEQLTETTTATGTPTDTAENTPTASGTAATDTAAPTDATTDAPGPTATTTESAGQNGDDPGNGGEARQPLPAPGFGVAAGVLAASLAAFLVLRRS